MTAAGLPPLRGLLAELLGGGWPEPPETIPLRILGLHQLSTDQDTIRQAFRARLLAAHPDMRDDAEAADANADVAELVWARDVLRRMTRKPATVAPVTVDEISPRPSVNRNGRTDFRCKVCDARITLRQWLYGGRWAGYCLACKNARIRDLRAQARADRTCENCGATFTPRRADGRYWSGACRQAAYRQRQGISTDTG